MPELYFKIAFAGLYLMYTIIRLPYNMHHRKGVMKTRSNQTREVVLGLLFLTGAVTLPWIWILSLWLENFAMALPDIVRISGIAIGLFSMFLVYLIHRALGKNWSPSLEIRDDHTLVTSGPYKHVRHPMYTQIWIYTFAQFLITSNWIVSLAGILTWATLYLTRVGDEEKMMLAEFGDEYRAYMKRTNRVIPSSFGLFMRSLTAKERSDP